MEFDINDDFCINDTILYSEDDVCTIPSISNNLNDSTPKLDENNKSFFKSSKKKKYVKNPNTQSLSGTTEIVEWSELKLCKPLLKSVNELHYDYPTKIQSQCIPLILEGRDLLGTAETGSGKTGSFLLPILERLSRSYMIKMRNNIKYSNYMSLYATKVIIISPTRELAVQSYDILTKLSQYLNITKILVIGGRDQRNQGNSFKKKPDIIVATPGRLLDFLLNACGIDIHQVEIVVLDEADRLLDLGFRDVCLEILSQCKHQKQTILFSATLSNDIKELALLSLKDPVCINTSQSHLIPEQLVQILVPINEKESTIKNHNLIRESTVLYLCFNKYPKERIIIFFRTKNDAHRMAIIFQFLKESFSELHGNLSQTQRSQELYKFQHEKSTRFLICSELASRGLDIPEVDVVINFMVPPDHIKYIHQIGRTARIGKHGISLTLYSQEEKSDMKKMLKKIIKDKNSDNVLKLMIKPSLLDEYSQNITEFENNIQKILQEERYQKEIQSLDIKINKYENLELYKSEIYSRPPKKWLQKNSRIRKKKINKKSIIQ